MIPIILPAQTLGDSPKASGSARGSMTDQLQEWKALEDFEVLDRSFQALPCNLSCVPRSAIVPSRKSEARENQVGS